MLPWSVKKHYNLLLTPQFHSLLTPHPCSLCIPAHSPFFLSPQVPALNTPLYDLRYRTPKCRPLIASPDFALREASAASLTHSIRQSSCGMYCMICRGLQASSKQPGRHCSSCCTAYQPCTCPPQQILDSISTRSRSRCLGGGAITGLGRGSHGASCCCKQSFAPEVIPVGGKGDRR